MFNMKHKAVVQDRFGWFLKICPWEIHRKWPKSTHKSTDDIAIVQMTIQKFNQAHAHTHTHVSDGSLLEKQFSPFRLLFAGAVDRYRL